MNKSAFLPPMADIVSVVTNSAKEPKREVYIPYNKVKLVETEIVNQRLCCERFL